MSSPNRSSEAGACALGMEARSACPSGMGRRAHLGGSAWPWRVCHFSFTSDHLSPTPEAPFSPYSPLCSLVRWERKRKEGLAATDTLYDHVEGWGGGQAPAMAPLLTQAPVCLLNSTDRLLTSAFPGTYNIKELNPPHHMHTHSAHMWVHTYTCTHVRTCMHTRANVHLHTEWNVASLPTESVEAGPGRAQLPGTDAFTRLSQEGQGSCLRGSREVDAINVVCSIFQVAKPLRPPVFILPAPTEPSKGYLGSFDWLPGCFLLTTAG